MVYVRSLSTLVRKIAADGSLPQFVPPGPNSTWKVDFPGPLLQCKEPSKRYRAEIEENIIHASSRSHSVQRRDGANMTVLAWPYRYVAWNADNDIYNEQPLEPLPFIYGDEQWVVNGEGPRYEISLPRSLRLNLAVMPSFVSDKMYLRNRTKAALATDQVFANSTFLQCSMVNATYHADFKFPNGAQDVQYEAIPLSEELVEPANWIDGPPNPWLPAAPMRANPKCSSVRSSDPDLQGSICSFDAQVFQRLSYQALMQVFSSLFIGFLFGRNDHPSRTSMPETVIWDHPTVKAIHVDPTALDNKTFSFQEAVAKAQSPLFQGLSADDLHVPTGSLADAIEALFQKIVIGAMAEESFQ